MTDAERVLAMLIHDLRTPLGVAHGYLRLITSQRLATAEERDKALDRTRDALSRMSRLCDDADQLLVPATPGPHQSVGMRVLAQFVQARLAAPLELGGRDDVGDGAVRVGTDIEQLANAVALVLTTAAQRTNDDTMALHCVTQHDELRFVAGPLEGLPPAPERDDVFDPWCGRGFALPLACRTVERAGGRIWTTGTPDFRVIVAMPLETNDE